ncbi:hypothetical protein LVJ94_23195 [Pendulispora rubella]|uniref:Secreted protein n=1 Tax=Pendulispora rubella TaxID=2741070 RepID=A0ABZ2LIB8_9BACT
MALFFALARVLVFAGALPMSGALPVLAEIVSGEANADACGDCDGDERGGCDCPAGCPACHCPHAGVPPLPRTDATALDTLPDVNEGVAPPHEANTPPAAPARSIYRPPRLS